MEIKMILNLTKLASPHQNIMSSPIILHTHTLIRTWINAFIRYKTQIKRCFKSHFQIIFIGIPSQQFCRQWHKKTDAHTHWDHSLKCEITANHSGEWTSSGLTANHMKHRRHRKYGDEDFGFFIRRAVIPDSWSTFIRCFEMFLCVLLSIFDSAFFSLIEQPCQFSGNFTTFIYCSNNILSSLFYHLFNANASVSAKSADRNCWKKNGVLLRKTFIFLFNA